MPNPNPNPNQTPTPTPTPRPTPNQTEHDLYEMFATATARTRAGHTSPRLSPRREPSLVITPPVRKGTCMQPGPGQPPRGDNQGRSRTAPRRLEQRSHTFPGYHPSHARTPSVVTPPGSRALLEQQSPAQVRGRGRGRARARARAWARARARASALTLC